MPTIKVPLNRLIAEFDETYIQALHLPIKTMHIQPYGGHTDAPMEVCCLAAFSESLNAVRLQSGSPIFSSRVKQEQREQSYSQPLARIYR